MTDSEIIDLFFRRDELAVSVTAAKYGERLRRVSQNIVGDPETAAECENDTYMRIWSSIPPAEPREHLFSYLACIIRRLSIDILRAQSRSKRSAGMVSLTGELEACIPSRSDMEKAMDSMTIASAINIFLSEQPKTKRIVFVRRYFYMDSIDDIASRFDMSSSKVTSMLMRLRTQLRKRLEADGVTL